MVIHVIGDSHTNIFIGTSNFKIYQRPICAHNLIEHHKKTLLDYIESTVKKGDHLLLAFGEIDCRLHFHYQSSKQGKPISQLIDETVARYMAFANLLSGIDFAIYNIVPTGTWKTLKYADGKSVCEIGLRKQIYEEFHQKLAHACTEQGVKLVDIWDKVADENGFTKGEYRKDEVHLNEKVLPIILKELDRVFGTNASAN